MPQPRPRPGPGLLAALSAAALVLLSACGSGDSQPDPAKADGTAAAFVQGLASGDLSAVSFRGAATAAVQADYAKVVAGMGDLTPGVQLGGVTENGTSASATLTWSWPLTDADTWTYTAPVQLAQVDGSWQVVWGHQDVEPTLNASSVLDLSASAAARGDILGSGGAPLVRERTVIEVGIDRSRVPAARVDASATRLAQLVGVDVAGYVKQVEASGPQAFVAAIVYRENEVPGRVQSAVTSIPGALLISDSRPLAPTREFAAPILGTVGEVTAEMVKDHPDLYSAGDVAGLSGLQARYDAQLQGTPGLVVDAVGSDGKQRVLHRIPAQDGTPLRLTLDERLETKAEQLLAGVGPASALVAMRPSTGAILVAANGPGNGGQNLATFGQYPPGSTFKSVSSLALLRSGLTPGSPVPCPATVDVDGRSFKNYSDYPSSALGRIPLRTAVANSCNTAFISERGRLGPKALNEAAGSLGLGIDHDLGFPAYFGSVPTAQTQTEAAADMIGQGRVLASPMAMATVIASIQHGSVVVPHLVEGVDGLDTTPPAGITPLRTSEDADLKTLLRGVVTSGSGAALADVPGPPVIAKTGTAEFTAADGSTKTHAWMIAAQGDLAVAVFVDLGASGSGTAGPILESFLRAARG